MRIQCAAILAAIVVCLAHAAALAQVEPFADALGGFAPETPLEARVGVKIDQITDVDQQSETFSIVGRMRITWADPALAFQPEPGEPPSRVLGGADFMDQMRTEGILAPAFTIQNQQARRFAKQSLVLWGPDGQAVYLEEFTATLQAPHFDFRAYPFDHQVFFVHVLALAPEEFVRFIPDPEFEGLGPLLGEEEWRTVGTEATVTTVEGLTGLASQRYSFALHVERERLYYVLRLMLPLLLLVAVSWANLFLDEYRRRIDIAGANLLVLVAFNFTIGGDLPRLGYLTFLDALLSVLFLITAVMVIYNVALWRMSKNGREDQARALDWHVTIWGYPAVYVVAFVVLYMGFLGG